MFEEKQQTLDALRSILLEDDRQLNQVLEKEINNLKNELLVPQNFAQKVDARTDIKIQDLRTNFSRYFSSELQQAVQKELKDSQEELINVLYPIMGKLVKKFIQSELEKLSQNIDSQINDTFSFEVWSRRIRAFFSGSDSSNIILSELAKPKMEEVFVIQNDSGLMMGSFSKNKLLDQDMIAGMLSAIKSFVEEAFHQENQTLNTIEYQNYKILIQEFFSYKIAFVVSGVPNADFNEKLYERCNEFSSEVLKYYDIRTITNESQIKLSQDLENYFFQ